MVFPIKFDWILNKLKLNKIKSKKQSFWGNYKCFILLANKFIYSSFFKTWKIYNVFNMLIVNQENTKKWRINKNKIELDIVNNKKYKIKVIQDTMIYAKDLISDYLSRLYYLVLWKKYL